ncbi:Uncharacterized protein APZ42_016073 [Daphnia magna]|uniref:Uncharacterized protein n=1 Tax=Daphnia magna TaxID=35525 RepID=A0A162NJU4_9CRUS|nr:Uncharacterized protein APZ42_016073 [Daphnia magna]
MLSSSTTCHHHPEINPSNFDPFNNSSHTSSHFVKESNYLTHLTCFSNSIGLCQ